MGASVGVETALLGELLEAHVALVGLLARVGPHVRVRVLLRVRYLTYGKNSTIPITYQSKSKKLIQLIR